MVETGVHAGQVMGMLEKGKEGQKCQDLNWPKSSHVAAIWNDNQNTWVLKFLNTDVITVSKKHLEPGKNYLV